MVLFNIIAVDFNCFITIGRKMCVAHCINKEMIAKLKKHTNDTDK